MLDISDLVPRDLPNGMEVAREGVQLAKTFECGVSAYCRDKGVRTESEYKRKCAETGKITMQMNIGLATIAETVEAIKSLDEYRKKTGVAIDRYNLLPDRRMALPPDRWDAAPRETGPMLESEKDWETLAQCAPIQPEFNDFIIGTPASISNTINALKAGAGYIGNLSQYTWNFPYWKDDVKQTVETVKALGVMAGKKGDGVIVDSYLDDGMCGQFVDYSSVVGWARFEEYIGEDLIGANMSCSFGGLMSEIPIKIAVWLALRDIKRSKSPMPFINGNTIDYTENFASNYAIVTAEMISFMITEKKYRTGCALLPIPASELVRVPTMEEIAEVHTVARLAQTRVPEMEKMIDFSYINERRNQLLRDGYCFFENILKGLKEIGVDITDPLQLLLAVRRLGAAKIEELFHPAQKNPSCPRGIATTVPTDMLMRSIKLKDETVKRLGERGRPLKRFKVVVGSTDVHEFGLYVIVETLRELGAEVVDAGCNVDIDDLLDLALETGSPHLAVSTHNGMAHGIASKAMDIVAQREQNVEIYMGGRLNDILEGQQDPVDVREHLKEMGIITCERVDELVAGLLKRKP